MCGNLSTKTQMALLNILEYIMQIRLIITIYVINSTRRVYIYMYLCIFPDYINRKYSVYFRLYHVQEMEESFKTKMT